MLCIINGYFWLIERKIFFFKWFMEEYVWVKYRCFIIILLRILDFLTEDIL